MNEDEKELLDMIIGERVDVLLRQMKCADKREDVLPLIRQAEAILRKLPHDEWVTLDRYINDMTDRLADEGIYLYSSGFTDGIRVLKLISSL